ncbi:MAG: glycoside hydrolase family 3 C-terminal domain-containing protein [Spirochaetes bacterium]|nr:glycoside hydrolase family 3 C-terminal domain-containing protein [Spirochaetota bacterium]
MKNQALIQAMSLEEKAGFITGDGFWTTKAFQRMGVAAIEMTDGPHGLRKMSNVKGQNTFANLMPTTAFPTASLSACSFDRSLLQAMGAALAEECRVHSIALLLGPGANIKRSPLCGRNFEYFSEDPLLSGAMARAWIEGLQQAGVGASLKHYAVNNQEKRRMSIDAVVDPRALHELYLASFEEAVRKGQPASVMCAYNKINGVLCSEHDYLLNTVLRDQWGFRGFVVTDWGASHNRVVGLQAGVDLAMPETAPDVQQSLLQAVQDGRLAEMVLDRSIDRLLTFTLQAAEQGLQCMTAQERQADAASQPLALLQANHQLALRIAEESSVLLKNRQLLPLDPKNPVVVIGSLARRPRYQGAGSSYLAPAKVSSFLDGLEKLGVSYEFADGYDCSRDVPDRKMEDRAVELARKAKADGRKIIYYLGLTDSYESEGFDREHMRLPANQLALLNRLTAADTRIAVVFSGGAPVETPWLDSVAALLAGYLGGQASGEALARLVFGLANPCGKLAESWPLRLEDNPSYDNFPGGHSQVLYKEGMFVGYRYYATAGKPVRFPFGYGLSYTSFRYDKLKLFAGTAELDTLSAAELAAALEQETLRARVTVTNTGTRAGREIVQLYAKHPQSALERPKLALAGFEKTGIEPGQTTEVDVTLSALALRYWNESAGRFEIENGEILLQAGPSSADLPLSYSLHISGGRQAPAELSGLPRRRLDEGLASLSEADFIQHCGRALPTPQPRYPYHIDSAMGDMAEDSVAVRAILKLVTSKFLKSFGADKGGPNHRMMLEMIKDMPLSKLASMSGGSLNHDFAEALVDLANHKTWRGLNRARRAIPKL